MSFNGAMNREIQGLALRELKGGIAEEQKKRAPNFA